MKIILFLLMIASCTKELKYSKEELFFIALKSDPTLQFIIPKSMNDGVHCSDYTSGCISGHTVRIKGLDMIAVEFMTEAEAILGAKKVRGYYVRNWMFDDVKGEPILEKFVTEVLKAKKP